MNKPLDDTHQLIERVEQYLQSKLDENRDFNDQLDTRSTVEIEDSSRVKVTSLTDPETCFTYDVSSILYWVERATYFDELEKWSDLQLEEQHRSTIEFIKNSNQVAIFQDFVAGLKRRRICPFVGAGVSFPAGYPLWGEALKSLAQQAGPNMPAQVKDDLKGFNYLQAAETLYKSNEHLFKNFVQTEFRLKPNHESDQPTFPPVIDLLPSLAKGCIVTTNFDQLIEKRFEIATGKLLNDYMYGRQAENGFITKLLKGEHCLMKLHGDTELPQSYVFTKSQYEESYGADKIDFSRQLPKALRQIYISQSFLFVGCSLEKDKTLELFHSVVEEGHFEIPDHFALLPDCPGEERAIKMGRLLKLKIRPIWYETKGADHSMLEKILQLAVDVAEKGVSLGGIR